jgi:hypothetical protein
MILERYALVLGACQPCEHADRGDERDRRDDRLLHER